MSCSGSHVVATVIGVIGLLMLLGAVATTSWMTGCISMADLIKSMKGSNAFPPGMDDSALSIMSGTSYCIHQGLFAVSMSVAGFKMQIPASLGGKPTYIYIVGALLLIGMIVAVVSIILFIIASCKNDETYDAKSKKRTRARVAFIVMACAGLVLTVGMAVYAGNTAEMIHNPMSFLVQFGQSAFSSMSNMFQGNNNAFGNMGTTRGKRDAGLENINEATVDANAALNAVKTMFRSMDPTYGASFIIGWVAVIFIFISAIIGFYAQHAMVSRSSYSGPDTLKL